MATPSKSTSPTKTASQRTDTAAEEKAPPPSSTDVPHRAKNRLASGLTEAEKAKVNKSHDAYVDHALNDPDEGALPKQADGKDSTGAVGAIPDGPNEGYKDR